ncbi:hypothetical protein N657DRAFT_253674 [Parathielavia appendiculata]|uniref:DUF676 domain-containing protein n=1 Tax=Parathielavia appendiculata TaxID=2587402 RepID=A0AAN6TSL5_9PEZI|nr:hypothetical protein N657DRAFT_253674 [Parathielavia appendiculata]
MESDANQNSPSPVSADDAEPIDAVAAASQIHVKDFSQAKTSPDDAEQGETEGPAHESQALQSSSSASLTAAGPWPGFVHVNGDVGGPGHNETFVDVIAVPCPGAEPIRTWTFGHELCGDANPADCPKHSPWIVRDLRMSANMARVFLYKHRALEEGMTLQDLSEDLLHLVEKMRAGATRPLFFIAHSIGGLVVKSALVTASRSARYQGIVDNCHGVTFLGTPHRGSSYMSMPNLRDSIQALLHLQVALPRSLAKQIRVNNTELLNLQEQFIDMASELRLWSFYETQESMLSGSVADFPTEIQFGVPLVSVKSALLDVWDEDVYAVDSDHAHLASFMPNSAGILDSYLSDLATAISKAALTLSYPHTPLNLGSHVKVEVTGFYEDPEALVGSPRQQPGAEAGSIIRLYSTKYAYRDFLKKGPERCLAERLHRGPKPRSNQRAVGDVPEEDPSAGETRGQDAGLDLPSSTNVASQTSTSAVSPEIVITSPLERPPLLRVPAQSEPSFRPPSPESNASVSTTASESAVPLSSDFAADEAHTIALLTHHHKMMMKEHDLAGTAGFSRPKPSQRKFVWVHVPFNNPVWVKEIFATFARTQGRDFSRLFDYDNWVSKQIQNRNSESQPAYLKAMCKYLSAADNLGSPRTMSPLLVPTTLGIMPNCLLLYIPYLHFDTYRSMIQRRKLISSRRYHGRAKPVPEWVALQESLELKVIWEYIGFDPPLNCRRTLDQFGHHSLRDTNSRDDDQMLYKLTKKDPAMPWSKSSRNSFDRSQRSLSSAAMGSVTSIDSGPDVISELKDGYVLMVDQLWLWSIDMTTLATFFPKRESSPTEGTLFQQADLRNSVYNELNGDLTGRTENTLDLAALIVWHAVTVLLDRSSHPDLEIFRIFDEAIGMLAERMTLNMKHFRINALDLEADDDEDDSDDEDIEGESPAAIKKRHRRELERSERENRENTSALLELRDLEDELNTLLKLFDMQYSTISDLKKIYTSKDFKDITKNGQEYLDEALEYLDEYKQTTAEMLKRVDTTRNDYEKMLEMVQRQAQVDEVRWSRLQAELASSQNLSVIIFTTFTVIFLPLTFFTGLFGMNTIEWQEENVPSLKEIGAISLPASVLLIAASLMAAFSWRVQKAFKGTYRGIRTSWRAVKRLYADRMEPESRKEAKRRRREEKKRRAMEAKMAHDDKAYDFWAMVKWQQRELPYGYKIPVQNVTVPPSADIMSRRKRA